METESFIMTSTINLSLEVPVKYRAEICVVGAGPSGIAAAVRDAVPQVATTQLASVWLPRLRQNRRSVFLSMAATA